MLLLGILLCHLTCWAKPRAVVVPCFACPRRVQFWAHRDIVVRVSYESTENQTQQSKGRHGWKKVGMGEENEHERPAGTWQPFGTCLIWRAVRPRESHGLPSPVGCVRCCCCGNCLCIPCACDICEGEQSVIWQHSSRGTSAGSFDGGHVPCAGSCLSPL